jgi:hypothetical protein
LYRYECEEKYKGVIYKLGVPMDPREQCVRFRESVLANWVCDACLWYYDEVCEENVQVCVLPAFCFSGRSEFPAGNFTLGNLTTVFARGVVEMAIVRIKREELKRLLEYGARSLPGESSNLMHVSNGFGYKFTSRGVSILEGDFESYVIALPSTLLALNELKGAQHIKNDEETKVLSEVVMQYCMANLSIFRGKDAFGAALDPLVRVFVERGLAEGVKNSLCPANPKMGRIVYSNTVV